jgi:kumamolisin
MKTRLRHLRRRDAAGFNALQLAARYGFPKLRRTAREHVALIELGGGFSIKDSQRYCSQLGIPLPPIHAISVLGAANDFTGDPNGADGEVALDVQNVLGATAGKMPIFCYFAPNTAAGFAAAIAQAAADNQSSALSISWGQEEASWLAQDLAAMESAFAACTKAGMSCFAASGDDGSSDGGRGNNVDYPASSPQVAGCGGTTIGASGEIAWSYGGGGWSSRFGRPAWQGITFSTRGVPDVAGDADPNSGYQVFVGGHEYVFGGTSAVAPMWAALAAILSTLKGQRLGLFGPRTWQLMDLTDVTAGSNGAFKARTGWDPCTGLGLPNAAFAQAVLAA